MLVDNSDKDGGIIVSEDEAEKLDSSPGKTSSLYVITVNYHSRGHLQKLIGSLKAIPFLKKLIIVNHSPSEGLGDLEADFPIEVINQENKGYGAGLNRGLREVGDKNSIALLCNPDIMVLNPEAMEELMDHMNSYPQIACAIPSMVNRELQPTPSYREFHTLQILLASALSGLRRGRAEFQRLHGYLHREPSQPFEVDWGGGGAMFFKTSLFPHPLCFDERLFLYFEDVDFCATIWKKGFSVAFYPKLVCYHDEQRQSRKPLLFLVRYIISLIKYIKKHQGLPQRERLKPSTDKNP